MKMALAREMTLTVLLFLVTYVADVRGAQCTTGEGCREYTSCKAGGTVFCCPGGERLEVNGSLGVCNCNETDTGLSCSGFNGIGKGSKFLPIKQADADCKSGTTCSNGNSCTVGSTNYCCPGGLVNALSSGGQLTSCSCRYDRTGSICRTYSSSSVTSASALICAMASFAALMFAATMSHK